MSQFHIEVMKESLDISEHSVCHNEYSMRDSSFEDKRSEYHQEPVISSDHNVGDATDEEDLRTDVNSIQLLLTDQNNTDHTLRPYDNSIQLLVDVQNNIDLLETQS